MATKWTVGAVRFICSQTVMNESISFRSMSFGISVTPSGSTQSILSLPICCISCSDTIFPPIRMKKCSVTAAFSPFDALFMKYSRKFFDMHDFCRNFILFPYEKSYFMKSHFSLTTQLPAFHYVPRLSYISIVNLK